MPFLGSMLFQESNSPVMEQLSSLHNHIMSVVILIIIIVLMNMILLIKNKKIMMTLSESHELELFWTISPAIILLIIGLPSIKLLYMMEEVENPQLSIKTLGQQWFWAYEYSNLDEKSMVNYLKDNSDGSTIFRLLETDNYLVLPINTKIRNLITALDVLHSWTIPTLGVKMDAIPGRINQINFTGQKPGIFMGQCSEICGANHSFMPITLEFIKSSDFCKWAY